MMGFMRQVGALVPFATSVLSLCHSTSPAFPVPQWLNGAEDLRPAFEAIEQKLQDLVSDEKYDASSFSVALTSNTETLWTYYHTARSHNDVRPGDTNIDGQSLYRIASITKTFTTLGILYQHEAGNLSLDDPVSHYIEELRGDDSGAIPWKDITLRTLASQLSGIPREFAQSDLFNFLPNPQDYGLPPVSEDDLIQCDEYDHYKPCNRSQLLEAVRTLKPLFAPNQRSTYSNLNFELLGLVLQNVTGLPYEDYMNKAIFAPLGMSTTTLSCPESDEHAVLPIGQNYWDVDEGVQAPTGGIYSNTDDMSRYIRYILTHYNAIAKGVNWFMPASWGTGMQNFYGMPFETFRTEDILLESKRPVTFVTKGGGLPGYYSLIIMMPEYGLGLTILVSGDAAGPLLEAKLREIITVDVVRKAESVIWDAVEDTYAVAYTVIDPSLNSSLSFTASASTGLTVQSFISNGTDVLHYTIPTLLGLQAPWHAQLTPTLLFKNESTQQGEIWRMLTIIDSEGEDGVVWNDACITDVDLSSYAGLPLNELVFWHEEGIVESPAWRLKLRKTTPQSLVVEQD